jgi:hypothetical protein
MNIPWIGLEPKMRGGGGGAGGREGKGREGKGGSIGNSVCRWDGYRTVP